MMHSIRAASGADLPGQQPRGGGSAALQARVMPKATGSTRAGNARLPLVNPDKLHRLVLPAATAFACQRACYALSTASPRRSPPQKAAWLCT